MDPFLHAYELECLSGDLRITQCPIQVINSEKFHPAINIFESWQTLKVMLSNSHRLQENLIVLRNEHLHQTDYAAHNAYDTPVAYG